MPPSRQPLPYRSIHVAKASCTSFDETHVTRPTILDPCVLMTPGPAIPYPQPAVFDETRAAPSSTHTLCWGRGTTSAGAVVNSKATETQTFFRFEVAGVRGRAPRPSVACTSARRVRGTRSDATFAR